MTRRRKACGHRNVANFRNVHFIGLRRTCDCERCVELADARKCRDCGAWLPLGPANDAPEAVRVEMRAAEIAAEVINCDGPYMTAHEWEGWILYGDPTRDDESFMPLLYSTSGYLARAITEHAEEGEG